MTGSLSLKRMFTLVLTLGIVGGTSAAPAQEAKPSRHADLPPMRTDRYGDPLPPGASARLGTVRWRLPRYGVDRLAVPDGKTLVSVNPLGGISIWDRATGKIVRQIPSEGEPRPEWLGQKRQFGTGHPGASQRSTALSADGGTAVFASPDGDLYVVDVATGKVCQRCRGHRGIIQETALSADGKILASRSEDDTLRIWDVPSGKEIRRLNVAKQDWIQNQPTHLALAADGKMAAWVGTEKERPIHVYDIPAGEEKHRLLELLGEERSIEFSTRGDLLLASSTKEPDQLWDVRTGRIIRTLPHKRSLYPSAAAFTPDGSHVALSTFGPGLYLYEIGTGKKLWSIESRGGSSEPHALAFAPDGQTLYAKTAEMPNWVLRRYDTRTGKHFAAVEEERGNFRATRFAADDRSLYTFDWDKHLRTWNASTGALVRQKAIPTAANSFSPDGRFLIFFDLDWAIHFVQLDTGKELWRQPTPAGRRLSSYAFSWDGTSLAVSEWDDKDKDGRRIVFRSTTDGAEQGQFNGLEQPAYDIHLCPDGRLLALLMDGKPTFGNNKIVFQDRLTGRKLHKPIRWAPQSLEPMAFSPNGRTLAVPSEDGKTIDFWECVSWKKRLELPGITSYPCPCAFSPDGLLFVVGDEDGAVRVFDAHTGRLLRRLEDHRARVSHCVFSHDGRKLATFSGDTTALIYDISDLLTSINRQVELAAAELRSLWEDLASADADTSYRAIGRLAQSGKEALSWLRSHLKRVEAADARLLAQLLADLDDDRFAVREQATTRLAEFGESALPALRKALAGKPSAEVRRRAEALVKQAEELSPSRLRIVRSVEVVESIGSTNAKTLLKEWAKGADAASLIREAKAALERLTRRHKANP